MTKLYQIEVLLFFNVKPTIDLRLILLQIEKDIALLIIAERFLDVMVHTQLEWKTLIKFKHKSTNLKQLVPQQLKQAPITAFISLLPSVTREKYQKITQKTGIDVCTRFTTIEYCRGNMVSTVSNYVTLQYNDAVIRPH